MRETREKFGCVSSALVEDLAVETIGSICIHVHPFHHVPLVVIWRWSYLSIANSSKWLSIDLLILIFPFSFFSSFLSILRTTSNDREKSWLIFVPRNLKLIDKQYFKYGIKILKILRFSSLPKLIIDSIYSYITLNSNLEFRSEWKPIKKKKEREINDK